jgi:uncharacterized protein
VPSPVISLLRDVPGRRAEPRPVDQTGLMPIERNVLGGELEPCGIDPITGFYRDGHCTCGPAEARHLICVVVTGEFLAHQRAIGNDLVTPLPAYRFPGLQPGDRWCVVLDRWLQSYEAGQAAPVVLAATNARVLEVVGLDVLRRFAVDVPDDLSSLG